MNVVGKCNGPHVGLMLDGPAIGPSGVDPMVVRLTTGCVCDGMGLTGVLDQHQLQQGTREAVKCGKVQPVCATC